MIIPIRPDQIQAVIPDEVTAVVNRMLAEKWNGKKAVLKQKEVASRIAELMGVKTDYLYKKNLLDIEEVYRQAGWKVKYDKPGYDESYDAFFVFTKGEGRN